jgi:hypothetical protein
VNDSEKRKLAIGFLAGIAYMLVAEKAQRTWTTIKRAAEDK